MIRNKKLKIFIAASKELRHKRMMFRAELSKMQNLWGVPIEVKTFEDFSNTLTKVGRQNDYNKYIAEKADLVAFIYDDKVGDITQKEFDVAYNSFSINGRPEILVYANKSDKEEIEGLKAHMNDLNQYFVEYTDDEDLLVAFKDDMTRYFVSHNFAPKPIPKINWKIWLGFIVAFLVVLGAVFGVKKYIDSKEDAERQILMIEQAPNGDYIKWTEDLPLDQLRAANEIMANMLPVSADTFMMGAEEESPLVQPELEMPQISQQVKEFYIGKYEVSVGEYCRIMNLPYEKKDADLPMTDVSFDDCLAFIQTLNDMTNLHFRLPTEAEWEYAARGGKDAPDSVFAGGDVATKVAWYEANSGHNPHVRNDENGGLLCNSLDLYDMSGNVSEWCDTPFRLYSDLVENPENPEIIDPDAMVVRGGNFDSEEYEITVTHREPMNRREKLPQVGFRLVLDKN